MTSKILALLVLLGVSVLDSADAVSCYQCNSTNAAFMGTSTCREPLDATNTANCSTPTCTWQFANYASPQGTFSDFYVLHRDCADGSTWLVDNCEEYGRLYNLPTFTYGESCCWTTSGSNDGMSMTYNSTACFCQKDNCNGIMPFPVASSTMAPSSTSARLDSPGAVSCYQCNSTNAAFLGTSTCREPLDATNTANCSTPMCTLQFTNYSSPQGTFSDFYVLGRDCGGGPTWLVDNCEEYGRLNNLTTFTYGDSCCWTSGPYDGMGMTYNSTACFCQKDNCNGIMPFPVASSTLAPSATSTRFDSSGDVSCYQCDYTNAAFLGTSTCSEPFDATATAKCSAPMCTWQLKNYTSPQSLYLLNRACMNDTLFLHVDNCEQYGRWFNVTTFIYGDSCCLTSGITSEDMNITYMYSITTCFCQKDNCNGNMPFAAGPSTMAPSTMTPSTMMPSIMAPSSVAPSTMAPSTMAPSNITPSTVAPSTSTRLNSSGVVSCYQCNYTNAKFLETPTCSEPFNAATAAKCSAPICAWQFSNYTSPQSFHVLHRDCVNDSTLQVDNCDEYGRLNNVTTLRYGDSCCFLTGPPEDMNITYSIYTCFCQKDNCNGNNLFAEAPSTMAPSAMYTLTRPTNAMHLLKPSLNGDWTLLAGIVWMVTRFSSAG